MAGPIVLMKQIGSSQATFWNVGNSHIVAVSESKETHYRLNCAEFLHDSYKNQIMYL